MVKYKSGVEIIEKPLKLKIRLDFKGEGKTRFLFGNKNVEKAAEEAREHNIALIKNIPFQGIKILDIDLDIDVYTIYDDSSGDYVAFAPVILTIEADTLEDVLRFNMRDEFRKAEIIEPDAVLLTKQEIERLLFKMNQELKRYKTILEKKYNVK